MAASLRDASFASCKVDPDVWMKAAIKLNGDKYWAYVLCYIDNLLVVSHKPQEVMDFLSQKYTLKEGSIKELTKYLGNQVGKWDMHDPLNPGRHCWAMSSDLYVKHVLGEVEKELGEVHQQLWLPSHVSMPMVAGYRPEVDGTNLLGARQANYFQGLIGVLRWICKLGQIDILHDVAVLLRFLMAPREGHLEQCLHIFAFLKKYSHLKIVFDNGIPTFDEEHFQQCDWEEFYPGVEEVVPPKAPKAWGRPLMMTCFVDANHAGC